MTREQFARWCDKCRLKPLDRFNTAYGDVLVAEGFFNDQPNEHPFGYYRQFYAVERNGMDIGRDLIFDAFHDPHLTPDQKSQARLNATLQDASAWLSLNVEGSGRYDQ